MKTRRIGTSALENGDLRILLVEDNPADADLLQEVLSQVNGRVEIIHVDRLAKAVHHLKQASAIDAVLLDLGLPDSTGLATLTKVDFAAPHMPILVLTGLEDESLAIEAVRHGAQDYLVKGQTKPNMLLRAIHHAIERKQAESVIAKLNQDLQRRVAELQTIFDTVPIGLAIAEDPEANHIRGNPAIERMLGVGEGGELSKGGPSPANFRCLQDGREMAVADLPIQKAVRGETVAGQVLDILRDDGRKVTVLQRRLAIVRRGGQTARRGRRISGYHLAEARRGTDATALGRHRPAAGQRPAAGNRRIALPEGHEASRLPCVLQFSRGRRGGAACT